MKQDCDSDIDERSQASDDNAEAEVLATSVVGIVDTLNRSHPNILLRMGLTQVRCLGIYWVADIYSCHAYAEHMRGIYRKTSNNRATLLVQMAAAVSLYPRFRTISIYQNILILVKKESYILFI